MTGMMFTLKALKFRDPSQGDKTIGWFIFLQYPSGNQLRKVLSILNAP